MWQLPVNVRQNVIFRDPRSAEERTAVAGACLRNLKIEIPALIDTPDNAAERAYTAWPDRLVLIDRDGRIAYVSRPGPFGFKPQELAARLAQVVAAAR